MLHPVESAPFIHGADAPLPNASGGPHTAERNHNTEVIVYLSSFFNTHIHMHVVPSIFSDYVPMEGWKLGTRISLCSVMDPCPPHLGQ